MKRILLIAAAILFFTYSAWGANQSFKGDLTGNAATATKSTNIAGGAAGSTPYQTSADTTTLLAVGAANLKSFVNAGGTTPEWANGMKIGTFLYDTATDSGTQDITGVGFKPSVVIFLAAVSYTNQMSIGFDDGTNSFCEAVYDTNQWAEEGSHSLSLWQTTAVVRATGYISAFGADGFTITWQKIGAKTGTARVYYLAFR